MNWWINSLRTIDHNNQPKPNVKAGKTEVELNNNELNGASMKANPVKIPGRQTQKKARSKSRSNSINQYFDFSNKEDKMNNWQSYSDKFCEYCGCEGMAVVCSQVQKPTTEHMLIMCSVRCDSCGERKWVTQRICHMYVKHMQRLQILPVSCLRQQLFSQQPVTCLTTTRSKS